MPSRWFLPSRYSRLPTTVKDPEPDENDSGRNTFSAVQFRDPNLPNQSLHRICMIAALFAGILGFGIGAITFREQKLPRRIVDAVPQVPIDHSPVRTFHFNESFATVPLAGSSEPLWDSLIPNGLGYVRDDPLVGGNLSVIGVFHQLHCLYTLRRAYYSTSEGGEDFDFGLDRTHHTRHCFEYLRQTIVCLADSTLEPAEHTERGFLGWGFQRTCWNYEALMDWAEAWRAFDGHGFLAHSVLHHG